MRSRVNSWLYYRGTYLSGRWPGVARVGAAATGAYLLWSGSRRRGYERGGLSFLGGLFLLEAVTHKGIEDLLGRVFSPVVLLRRAIHVSASAEDVYAFLRDPANLSRFMSYVESVRANADGSLHWVIRGPGDRPIEWDTVITAALPGTVLAWESRRGAAVANRAEFLLSATGERDCRVEIELAFAPPAGVVGYGAAHLLGFDPRTRIDADLKRLKQGIESMTGRPARVFGLNTAVSGR